MADDNGWDMSDFLQQYTTKSKRQSSPLSKDKNLSDMFDDEADPLATTVDFDNENIFCTKENVEQRLLFLSQELSMLGYTSILSEKSSTPDNVMSRFDLTKLVNNTYDLIKRQRTLTRAKDEINERRCRLEKDNEYLLQNQARLKQDLENVKREAALLLCREKEQIDKCRSLQQDLKSEREEKRKMKADVDHLKKQFYHETKRHEKESSRLKEKIHQLLNDKQERKMGLELLNGLQRTDGKRSLWKTGGMKKNEDEMYKLVISNFEDRHKTLTHENQCMREVLSNIQNELVSMDTSNDDVEDDNKQLDMPFHIVRQDVETKLRSLLDSLKQRIDGKTPAPPTTMTDDDSFSMRQQNEELQTKLDQLKAVINGQEKIIKNLKNDYSKEAFEKLLMDVTVNADMKMETGDEIVNLKEEQRKLKEERAQFSDYVLKIAKEKEDFEKERVEFYMHCISTPVINKEKKKKHKEHHKETPSNNKTVTPSFSPARPLGKVKTPNTAELYKFMSLHYDSGISRASDRLSSLDGSYTQADRLSMTSPSSMKVQEHVDNVRRAVEERHNRSAGTISDDNHCSR